MALNPPMFDALTPMAVQGEFFLLSRKGIHFQLAMEGFPKLKAKGLVYVTTLRMVFVAYKPVSTQGIELTGFDMPLQLMGMEKFHQPIFGANYLSFNVAPIPGMGLSAISKVSLTFTEGGVGTLLPLLARGLQEVRNPSSTPVHATLSTLAQQGALTTAAFVDPNDPSTIYVTQPVIPAAQPAPVNAFYGAGGEYVPTAVPVPPPDYAEASVAQEASAMQDAKGKR